jgi:predicted Zn-dependent protease
MNPFAIGFLRAAKIAAYGRDQERDADRGGQLLAAKAGYDPRGIANFLRKLDAAERYEIGWARLPSFFATHPTSPERSAIAINRAISLKWTRAEGVAGNRPADYYEKIDGLIIGDDPAGGLFDEENRFVHPELQFSIRFPQGWETMNSQQAVRAVSPRRDAQAELAALPLGGESLEEVVDTFLGRATSGFGRLDVSITFVLYDELVFRLTVLTLPEAASRYRGRTRSFAHSFRPLEKDAEYSLKVTRLRIALAKENETLQDLSKRTRNELELVYTGVLNGLYASTPLARRAAIKIGIEEPYRPRPNAPKETEPDADADADAARMLAGDDRRTRRPR